jgi:hypothetical protein
MGVLLGRDEVACLPCLSHVNGSPAIRRLTSVTDFMERRQHAAPQPECPSCGASEAHHMALRPPVVSVRCNTCETTWHIRDRRTVHRLNADALGRFPPEDEFAL